MALTTDATPSIHLSAVQVLRDEHRMKRLKAALCPGIFSYAEEDAATQIFDDVLKICGRSTETLSEVIQTKFFAGHTPFHWLMTKRHSRTGVPPLFLRLLSVCETLSKEVQEEIVDTFYQEYDSDLYTTVKLKLTENACMVPDPYSGSEFFPDDEDRPVVTSAADGWTNFSIPKFFDRIMVDEEVSLVFFSHDKQWRLTATMNQPTKEIFPFEWSFNVVEINERSKVKFVAACGGWTEAERPKRFRVFVELYSSADNDFKRAFTVGEQDLKRAKSIRVLALQGGLIHTSTVEAFSKFYSDSFTPSSNRELRGRVMVAIYDRP